MKYRITPRGLYIQNNQVLFAEYLVGNSRIYALPGGKQRKGESLSDCLIREFNEELNLEITIGPLILVKEFIHPSNAVPGWENGIHQVEIIFKVETQTTFQPDIFGEGLDNNMLGAKLFSASELRNLTYFPEKEPNWFFAKHSTIPYLLDDRSETT